MSDEHPPASRLTTLTSRDSELPRIEAIPVDKGTKRIRRLSLIALLIAAFVGVAYVVAPLWTGVAFGALMAFTMQPVYRKFLQWFRDRQSLAAVVTTALTGLMTLTIGGLSVYFITKELVAAVNAVRAGLSSGTLTNALGKNGFRVLKAVGVDPAHLSERIAEEAGKLAGEAAKVAGVLVQATTSMMLSGIFGLMTMYYVLIEWRTLPVKLERVLPLDPRHTRAIILELRDVGRSALVGTLATAVVQGALGSIGYAIAGVPNVILLGLVTAIASFLPVVGTAIVWSAVSAYLAFAGHTGKAIFMLGWGTFVIMALSDYVIRPMIVGAKGEGHPLLMLIGLVGGIEAFGLSGLLFGPILMSLFVVIFRIYERELQSRARGEDAELDSGRTMTPHPSTRPSSKR